MARFDIGPLVTARDATQILDPGFEAMDLARVQERSIEGQERRAEEIQPFLIDQQKRQQRQNEIMDPLLNQVAADKMEKFQVELGLLEDQKEFMDSASTFFEAKPFVEETRKIAADPNSTPEQINKSLRTQANIALNANNPRVAKELLDMSRQPIELTRAELGSIDKLEKSINARGKFLGLPMFGGGKGATGLRTGATITFEKDGRQFVGTPITDPTTGRTTLGQVEIPGTLTSRVGETPEERRRREISTAGGKTAAQLEAEAAGIGDVITTKKQVTGAEDRATTTIDRGLQLAEGLPMLNRTLNLLKLVQTGGVVRQRILQGQNYAGITAPNTVELSTNLGRNVLSQLRQTFGAQFTEKDREAFEQMEAGFGKSTAGNIRLLEQAKTIAINAAERAQDIAAKQRDFETVRSIQLFIDEQLDPLVDNSTDQAEVQEAQGGPIDAVPQGGQFMGFE